MGSEGHLTQVMSARNFIATSLETPGIHSKICAPCDEVKNFSNFVRVGQMEPGFEELITQYTRELPLVGLVAAGYLPAEALAAPFPKLPTSVQRVIVGIYQSK